MRLSYPLFCLPRVFIEFGSPENFLCEPWRKNNMSIHSQFPFLYCKEKLFEKAKCCMYCWKPHWILLCSSAIRLHGRNDKIRRQCISLILNWSEKFLSFQVVFNPVRADVFVLSKILFQVKIPCLIQNIQCTWTQNAVTFLLKRCPHLYTLMETWVIGHKLGLLSTNLHSNVMADRLRRCIRSLNSWSLPGSLLVSFWRRRFMLLSFSDNSTRMVLQWRRHNPF